MRCPARRRITTPAHARLNARISCQSFVSAVYRFSMADDVNQSVMVGGSFGPSGGFLVLPRDEFNVTSIQDICRLRVVRRFGH